MRRTLLLILPGAALVVSLGGCGGQAAARSTSGRAASSAGSESAPTRSAVRPPASGVARSIPAVGARAPTGQVLYGWGRGSPREPAFAVSQPALNGAAGGRRATTTPTAIPGVAGRIVAITASNTDGYALTAQGTVWAWGQGLEGQLGDGTERAFAASAVRVRFPPGVRIVALPDPVPYDGGMAIDASGHVWGWGNNTARQFCRRPAAYLTLPIRIPLAHVTLAAGALFHTIYDAGGRVYSCGLGNLGQLGNGTTGRSGRPTAVRGLPPGRVAELTSSWGDAGALMADGAYYDWGYNAAGQVGDGSERLADVAVRVSLPGPVTEVSQGGSLPDNGQTMALLANGSLWEWGSNRFGQLGDGSFHKALRPLRLAEPPGVRFVKIDSGGATDYAIDSSGYLWAWGHDNLGQVGDGLRRHAQRTPVRDDLRLSAVSSTAAEVAGFYVPR